MISTGGSEGVAVGAGALAVGEGGGGGRLQAASSRMGIMNAITLRIVNTGSEVISTGSC